MVNVLKDLIKIFFLFNFKSLNSDLFTIETLSSSEKKYSLLTFSVIAITSLSTIF